MTVRLTFDCEIDGDWPVDTARLELVAACALEAGGYLHDDAGDDEVEINLCLVDREASARLNNAYRGKDYATNVLSFPAGAEVPGLVALGDLVVCMPVVAEEAAAQGKTVDAHLMHLVAHGTLHLLGFDHAGDSDAEAMEMRERKVLAGFGVPDPYSLPDAPDSAT